MLWLLDSPDSEVVPIACCVGSYRFCAKHLADSGDTISRERESTVSRGSARVAANSCPVSRREEGIELLNTLHFGPDTKSLDVIR